MKKEITSSYIFCFLLVLSAILFQSCDSNSDDPTANLPVCDCIELQPQRDALGEKINGRGHIMYLKDSLYTGKCVAYHLDNTTKKVELIFQNGLLNGKQQVWDDKGNRVLEVPMSQGKFHGTLMEWDDENLLVSKVELSDNKIIGSGYCSYVYDKNKKGLKEKSNKYLYNIYTLKEPVSLDYHSPNWFINPSKYYDGNPGYGYILAGLKGSPLISANLYGTYTLSDLSHWSNESPDKSKFEKILNEFHKENPSAILRIDRLSYGTDGYGMGFGTGFVNVDGFVQFDKHKPAPANFINFCSKLKNISFLKFNPELDDLLVQSGSIGFVNTAANTIVSNDSSEKTITAKSNRVYFHKEPDQASRTDKFFVKGQKATLLEDFGDYLKVDFEYNGVHTIGFVNKYEITVE